MWYSRSGIFYQWDIRRLELFPNWIFKNRIFLLPMIYSQTAPFTNGIFIAQNLCQLNIQRQDIFISWICLNQIYLPIRYSQTGIFYQWYIYKPDILPIGYANTRIFCQLDMHRPELFTDNYNPELFIKCHTHIPEY